MSIAERYARSVQSSNLKDDAFHHDTDKLAAMALSKRLGSELFRVKYCNDATSYPRLLEEWTKIVQNKAGRRKWPKHVKPEMIAKTALDYWINPLCVPCDGKGFDAKINKGGQYEAVCKACGGTGSRNLPGESNIKQYVADMIETLRDMERISGSLAVKKLSTIFDI